MSKLRFYIALWAAKVTIFALKVTHHNGTQLPGTIALKICPEFLKFVEKPPVTIVVTGTNGKTTCSNMITDLLEADGKRVMSNRYGSNILAGVVAVFARDCSAGGKNRGFDYAVLEIDERSAPRIYPYIDIDYQLITNLFRDSIMRNAHPFYIGDILTSVTPANTKLIVNADDIISSGVAPKNPRVHYGICQQPGETSELKNIIDDLRICPQCNAKLEYDWRRYHHLGQAHCPACGFASATPEYFASAVNMTAGTMTVTETLPCANNAAAQVTSAEASAAQVASAEASAAQVTSAEATVAQVASAEATYAINADSIFNVYNILAAVALLRELGYAALRINELMTTLKVTETRHYEERVGKVTLIRQMSKDKNALAGSRVFDYIAGLPGNKEILLMMNCLDDSAHWSENTCWIFDTDFEFLNNPSVRQVVCAGARAKDYKLRLRMAGVPEERIVCERDEFAAADRLIYADGGAIYVLYGLDSMNLMLKVYERMKTNALAVASAEATAGAGGSAGVGVSASASELATGNDSAGDSAGTRTSVGELATAGCSATANANAGTPAAARGEE